jgi:hypothetical protein
VNEGPACNVGGLLSSISWKQTGEDGWRRAAPGLALEDGSGDLLLGGPGSYVTWIFFLEKIRGYVSAIFYNVDKHQCISGSQQ